MARRLVLHVGAMKSGTSFVQHVLTTNAERLRDHGVLWPGRTWWDQVGAVLELIEHGSEGQEPFADDGPWRRLVDEVHAWDGDAVVSMEFLGPRNADKIRLVLDAFGDTDVRVVVTARDLPRQLPAMWQESVQNGGQHSWPEYVEAVRAFPKQVSKPGRSFWRQQGVAETVRRWTEAVGRDRFTLVTVPPPGSPPGELWDRFTEATGLPAGVCEVEGPRNASIGTASAMVLRDLNRRLGDRLTRHEYDVVVKYGLAKTALSGRDEPKVGFDEAWLRERAQRQVRRLRDLDPHVVGDLADLEPRPVPGVAFADLDVAGRLDAATDGLAHLVDLACSQRRDIKELRRDVKALRRKVRRRDAELARLRGAAGPGPLAAGTED
ncbi:hypothetical protein GCM10009737_28750 [Nocardioides lentus]|uniref:Sulfotransferase family protein n=1 Tax=Nocardioides lentus TaxID=338077 RepID=A0ABN2PQH0_9ACTN